METDRLHIPYMAEASQTHSVPSVSLVLSPLLSLSLLLSSSLLVFLSLFLFLLSSSPSCDIT